MADFDMADDGKSFPLNTQMPARKFIPRIKSIRTPYFSHVSNIV
jgi:hypothetical protein